MIEEEELNFDASFIVFSSAPWGFREGLSPFLRYNKIKIRSSSDSDLSSLVEKHKI